MATDFSQVHFLYLVPSQKTLGDGTPEAQIERLRRRVKKGLEAAGITCAVATLDFSINEDRTGTIPTHLSIHVWICVLGAVSERQKRDFFSFFPATDDVPRPRRSSGFDGDLRALAYGLKPNFHRRETYVQEKSPEKGGRVCRNTRGRPIRADQAVALMLMLDRIGLGGRIMLRGARMTLTRDGVVIRRLGVP